MFGAVVSELPNMRFVVNLTVLYSTQQVCVRVLCIIRSWLSHASETNDVNDLRRPSIPRYTCQQSFLFRSFGVNGCSFLVCCVISVEIHFVINVIALYPMEEVCFT